MRRESSIDRDKQTDRVERARRMKPEERLAACVSLSRTVFELHLAAERHRKADTKKQHS